MDGQGHRPGDLGIRRLLWLFATMAVTLLVLLASAPVRGYFTEWRAVQKQYNERARQVGAPPVAVGIKQLWKPELDVVDRCTSCHLGAGEATPDPHTPLFAAHPAMPHEPRDFGCTVCHSGQGRATTQKAAHGFVEHWDEPMLERPNLQSGCGVCHSHVPVPAPTLAARGQAVFEQNACADCHRIAGRGRGEGPDLSTVGLKGHAADWHDRHAARARAASSGPWKTSFAALAAQDLDAVNAYLSTLIGAPRLVAGKLLSIERGCRGCHRIAGRGGDEGPDLSNVARKVVADIDFSGVRGSRTLSGWLRAHFDDPARVVPGSQMPAMDLSPADVELLTTYMLSLRPVKLPEGLMPPDRVRGALLGVGDLPGDGASLFAAFCSGCHGPRGEGLRLGVGVGELTFPAIGHPDFLAVADDGFILATIAKGRPGRHMPGWSKEGGLQPHELGTVVAWLRGLEPAAPPFAAVTASRPDADLGQRLYRRDCRICHGDAGEGTALGTPLASRNGAAASEVRVLYDALVTSRPGMGSYRGYDAVALRSVIAHVRGLPGVAALRAPWKPDRGNAARGAAVYGGVCSGCHGARGEGGKGPALANVMLLSAATDEYLAATIVRGRAGTAMPPFGATATAFRTLAADDVADVVAFVRTLDAVVASTAQQDKGAL